MKRKKYISENTETEKEKQNETSFYRLIFMGDNEVGKTQIINKYNNTIYQKEYFPTYCIDFKIKTIQIDGKLINIHCIDTQGSSNFVEVTGTLFIQKSDAFIYVFDITSAESFENLVDYVEKIKLALTDSQKMIKEKIVYFVGNKYDLINERQINENEGRLKATKYKAKYIEVSAKTGWNINKLFDYIIQDLIKKDQDSFSFDGGGGILHKSIYNNNNINNTNIINNNINEIKNNDVNDINEPINTNNIININNNIIRNNNYDTNNNINKNLIETNSNVDTYNNIETNNNINTNNHINTNSNIIENEKSGLYYDNSTYHLKSNTSIYNNNDIVKNINNPGMNNNKEEIKNSKTSNNNTSKCHIF